MTNRTHRVSADAVNDLAKCAEALVAKAGLEKEWRRYVLGPVKLETDYDWPLRMAIWLLERRT